MKKVTGYRLLEPAPLCGGIGPHKPVNPPTRLFYYTDHSRSIPYFLCCFYCHMIIVYARLKCSYIQFGVVETCLFICIYKRCYLPARQVKYFIDTRPSARQFVKYFSCNSNRVRNNRHPQLTGYFIWKKIDLFWRYCRPGRKHPTGRRG